MVDITDKQLRVLLLMLDRVNRPWTRFAVRLLEIGRRNVPETRDSRNPVKFLLAQTGSWMLDREQAKCWKLAEEES